MKTQTLALKPNHPHLFWLSLLVIMLAAAALRAWLLNSFPLSPDEGIHLMWLRLLSAGYRPYTQVYITYPPLYPLAIQAVWTFWPTEAAQRWFSVGYTLFGAVGVALLARKLAGEVAGIAAAGLTLFSPVLVEPSRAILAEFPSVAWSVWAIWLAWLAGESTGGPVSHSRRRYVFLILSGLCLSASLLTKLLSPFVGGLILLMMVQAQTGYKLPVTNYKSVWLDLVVWGLALILPALILISAFDVNPLAQQVVAQRLGARTAAVEAEAFWPPRYERGMMFGQEDPVLVVLGLVGMGMVWMRRPKNGWVILTWLALALVMLAIHNPIRYKHFLILIPPLAVLGGLAISQWIYNLRLTIDDLRLTTARKEIDNLCQQGYLRPVPVRGWAIGGLQITPYKTKIVAVAGLVLLIGLYLWLIPGTLTRWQASTVVPQPPTDEVKALAFIQEVTAPQDCLISDDMPLLYWSGRPAPPELAEVSTNRLESGALTTGELQTITDRYDCQVVAAVSNRITKYLPDYMDWMKQKYLGRFHYGEDNLYFAKIDTRPHPATPLQADFNGQFIFHGYTLPASARAGDRVPLTLTWQAQTHSATAYAIFVQLRDAANVTLTSADHQPYQGLLPTSTWPPGAVIQEVAWLPLPPDIPPGRYQIYVGLYRPDTLARLPLRGDTSGENALILGPLEVP